MYLNLVHENDEEDAKVVALRCGATAALLEWYLDHEFQTSNEKRLIEKSVLESAHFSMYQVGVTKKYKRGVLR